MRGGEGDRDTRKRWKEGGREGVRVNKHRG